MEGRFAFSGSMSLKDLFCAHVFINFWVLPVLNPFGSELVGRQSHPFYQELYDKMSEVTQILLERCSPLVPFESKPTNDHREFRVKCLLAGLPLPFPYLIASRESRSHTDVMR